MTMHGESVPDEAASVPRGRHARVHRSGSALVAIGAGAVLTIAACGGDRPPPPDTARYERRPAADSAATASPAATGREEVARPAGEGGEAEGAVSAAAPRSETSGRPVESPTETAVGEPEPGGETAAGAASEGDRADAPSAEAVGEAARAGVQGTAPDPERLLALASDAYFSLESLRARFHQTLEVPLLERRSEGHGVWYQKGRNRFRMDFEEPPEDEIVADGTYLWVSHPSSNPGQVVRSTLAAGPRSGGTVDLLSYILQEARRSYEATYVERERVAGTETHLILLRPQVRSPYRRIRLWVGADDHLVRKFEILEESESIRTVTLTELEPDVSVPDSLFRFRVPPGAEVFEG